MKILVVGTSTFAVPLEGYGGLEEITYQLACGYAERGHQVTFAAAQGSKVPPNVELIELAPMESEEASFVRYRERLESFDVIHSHGFGGWPYIESIGVDPPLPIVQTLHTDPSVWGSPPPVPWPCVVGLSRSHGRRIALTHSIATEYVYNGIDLDFYKPSDSGTPQERSNSYLFMGRYTPEKGPLDLMLLCRRLKMPLDVYGDTLLTGNPGYADRCRAAADEVIVRWHGPVSRKETVDLYRNHKALLFMPVWDEPFGLVLVEAQACGMPVLTLAHGACPEVVKHGETGYVVNDIAEFEKVLKSGCLSSISPEACIEWAGRFSIDRMVDGYLALLERCARGERW